MQLFIQIALMCLINTLLPDIIRNYLKISRFWPRSKVNLKRFQLELDAARKELDNVLAAQHIGEYSKKIKTMRAEQKVKEADAMIKLGEHVQLLNQSTIDTVAYYVLKVLLSLILIIVCARNRYLPVMIFSDSFSLEPLGGLLSFPTGVYNAISVPAWAFSCNFTFRLLYGLVKK